VTTTYISVTDVEAQLNASGPDSNGNFTVYGLTITPAAFQAHTDYANNYMNALIGSDLQTTDPKYLIAKGAALNLACLRVLVVTSGGALVGAYDYFLGDLRVARAGPYAAAIQRTIEGLKEDLVKAIINMASAAKAAEASAAGDVPTYKGGLVSP
jgi:hypothetical protein